MVMLRYDCSIGHTRRTPVVHTIAHRSPLWLVDLDDLPALPRPLRFFGSFDSRDHWARSDLSIRQNIDAFLVEHGRPVPARVQMLTGSRSFGHCFNPISIYWCLDANGDRQDVVVEVHNTYHGRHAYLLEMDELGRASVQKAFYVSPFIDGHGRYRMRISAPGDRLDVLIALEQDGAVPFTASMHGTAHAASRWSLVRRPLPQLRVAALIRWHGIALWLKKVAVRPRSGPGVAPEYVAGNQGRDVDSDRTGQTVGSGQTFEHRSEQRSHR